MHTPARRQRHLFFFSPHWSQATTCKACAQAWSPNAKQELFEMLIIRRKERRKEERRRGASSLQRVFTSGFFVWLSKLRAPMEETLLIVMIWNTGVFLPRSESSPLKEQNVYYHLISCPLNMHIAHFPPGLTLIDSLLSLELNQTFRILSLWKKNTIYINIYIA